MYYNNNNTGANSLETIEFPYVSHNNRPQSPSKDISNPKNPKVYFQTPTMVDNDDDGNATFMISNRIVRDVGLCFFFHNLSVPEGTIR